MVTVDPLAVVAIDAPVEELADEPAMVTFEEVLVEVLAIVRTAVASVPSGISVWFKPVTRHIYRPAEGALHKSCLLAALTEGPAVIVKDAMSVVE
jgi:hypothetical protein